MITRLITFFKRYVQGSLIEHSIWNSIVKYNHGDLIEALNSGDAEICRKVLDSAGTMMQGLEQGYLLYWDQPRTHEFLKRLARRVGVLPVFNPEQPSNNFDPAYSEDLRIAVEKQTGFIGIPDGFIFKKTTSGVSYTHFYKLGEWFTIKSFLGKPRNVLEIGGGVGNTAVLAHRDGVENFTMIDLPSVAVQSAYFMSNVCRAENIWLGGETEKPCWGRWFSSSDYKDMLGSFHLIMNTNSFPEMMPKERDEYIEFISQRLSDDGVFYSNNHESNISGQGSVHDAIVRNGKFKLVYRAPFMIRDGYIEEIYRLKH